MQIYNNWRFKKMFKCQYIEAFQNLIYSLLIALSN